ncbi:Hypothetical predicted protein [Lecanosticta acicola]|uniref:Uncharacterized protein n=1 Tax=Lecanosticta acicola TaxID=111012 RepID=A0AAI8YXJ9_9PEZI|nr:Hypothetical predicted protein [Lecanosticta acicola]
MRCLTASRHRLKTLLGWHRDLDFAEEAGEYCCKDHFSEDTGCSDHFMSFQAKFSPTGYGRVVHGSISKLKPTELKHVCRSTEGLLALEIQDSIYRFLLGCAKLILHDIQPAEFCTAPHQPMPEMPRPAGGEAYKSLSDHSLEAPYRTPYKPDLERLKMLFESRRTSAEDHIWLLREDPSYFMDSLREWKEHGGSEKMCYCRDCWNREAGRLVTDAFVSYIFFDDIYRKLSKMDPIDVQLKRVDDKKVRLNTNDENQWTALVELIEHALFMPLDSLQDGLPTSPRLRNRYSWTGPSGKEQWHMKSRSSKAEYRVDRLFFALFSDEQRGMHGFDALIQEVQYMIERDSEASQYIDAWIANQFSDLALLAELNKSIDAFAPYFDQNKAHMLIARQRAAVDRAIERTRSAVVKLGASIKFVCSASDLAWDPLDKDEFLYPVDKRPTKANIEQMRKAEESLDMFWWTLDEEVKDLSKMSLERTLDSRMFQPRGSLYRTKPWKEPIQLLSPETPRKQVLGELDPNVPRVFESAPHDNGTTPTRTFKEKIKTRGTPAAVDPRLDGHRGPLEQLPTPPETPSKPAHNFKIPKKAFKILCALLPSPSSVLQQRCEIAWEEFLMAMQCIGLEPEKLYGSVWIFSPMEGELLKCDARRSIQFHEPKEVRRGQKIARPMVRTYGRRLKHAFGWESAEDMFECE